MAPKADKSSPGNSTANSSDLSPPLGVDWRLHASPHEDAEDAVRGQKRVSPAVRSSLHFSEENFFLLLKKCISIHL